MPDTPTLLPGEFWCSCEDGYEAHILGEFSARAAAEAAAEEWYSERDYMKEQDITVEDSDGNVLRFVVYATLAVHFSAAPAKD